MRGYPFIPGSSLMAVNAARVCCRQQKPGTSVYVVSRRVRSVGIEFGEPALCARQALLGSRQQPLDRLRPVTFDGISIVVQTAVIEDAKIKLCGGFTAFGSKPEVPHRAGFHGTLLAVRKFPLLQTGANRRSSVFNERRRRSPRQHRSQKPASANRDGSQDLHQLKAFRATMICRRPFTWALKYFAQWEFKF